MPNEFHTASKSSLVRALLFGGILRERVGEGEGEDWGGSTWKGDSRAIKSCFTACCDMRKWENRTKIERRLTVSIDSSALFLGRGEGDALEG